MAQKVGTGFTSTACKDKWTELVSFSKSRCPIVQTAVQQSDAFKVWIQINYSNSLRWQIYFEHCIAFKHWEALIVGLQLGLFETLPKSNVKSKSPCLPKLVASSMRSSQPNIPFLFSLSGTNTPKTNYFISHLRCTPMIPNYNLQILKIFLKIRNINFTQTNFC